MSIQVVTKVLPGNRVEVADASLAVGEEVRVTIELPPSKRTREEWEEFDRQFRAERDAWD